MARRLGPHRRMGQGAERPVDDGAYLAVRNRRAWAPDAGRAASEASLKEPAGMDRRGDRVNYFHAGPLLQRDAAHTKIGPKENAMRAHRVAIVAIAVLVLAPATALARNVFLNGIKLDSNVAMKPQTFSG